MGKFKISLKIQGFELEIEGDRPDVSAISNAVSQQITGMLKPAAALASGDPTPPTPSLIEAESENGKKLARSARKKSSGSRTSSEGPTQPIDFRHQPDKYGNPKQSWSVAEKSIWILAVLKGIADQKEVSGPQIAATFNDKFKQAGRVHPPNVTRDLGIAKVQNPAPVGQDKDLWYLTDEGDRQAKELIQSVLAPAS